MACDRVAELKRETGRIGVIELKKLVVRVYFYLCVVALQYLAPLILLMCCTLMLKTLGEYSVLCPIGLEIPRLLGSPATASASSPSAGPEPSASVDEGVGILGTAAQLSLALSRLKLVFTPLFYRGILSYFCWWICTSWFVTSAFGMMYYSYFSSV